MDFLVKLAGDAITGAVVGAAVVVGGMAAHCYGRDIVYGKDECQKEKEEEPKPATF